MAVGQAALERAKPTPGSLMICISCGAISLLAQDWTLRPLTDAEAQSLSPEMVMMLATVEASRRAVMGQNGRKRGLNLRH